MLSMVTIKRILSLGVVAAAVATFITALGVIQCDISQPASEYFTAEYQYRTSYPKGYIYRYKEAVSYPGELTGGDAYDPNYLHSRGLEKLPEDYVCEGICVPGDYRCYAQCLTCYHQVQSDPNKTRDCVEFKRGETDVDGPPYTWLYQPYPKAPLPYVDRRCSKSKSSDKCNVCIDLCNRNYQFAPSLHKECVNQCV